MWFRITFSFNVNDSDDEFRYNGFCNALNDGDSIGPFYLVLLIVMITFGATTFVVYLMVENVFVNTMTI